MNQTVCILGRQPALGMAELESLYGTKALQPLGNQAALLDLPVSEVPIARLGGTLKVASLIAYIPSTEWPQIINYLSSNLPRQLQHIPEGKLTIGLSLYGLQLNPSKINAGALSLKKALKSAKRGVRIVPNKQAELNTAQVIHNHLTGPTGLELLLIRVGKRVAVAQTVAVQDIDAYAARDQVRPARDARVGMLPPKLAQIIINLTGVAAGRLLDPFCGTGVVLQEAGLMGYQVYGTDLEERMIRYSRDNLNWLEDSHHISFDWYLETGDATAHTWQQPIDTIAGETYLGRPFASMPEAPVLNEVVRDVNTIHEKFLRNVARQTPAGFRLCMAVPAWKTKTGFRHLPVLDQLTDLGYTRTSFVHVDSKDLVYHRPDQVVARELVTLIRK